MSQLLLVCELEDGVSIDELLRDLKAACSIQNVWMDPYNEPRAVVLCDKKLDLRAVKIKASRNSTVEMSSFLETAKPTKSVFVKTYKSITFGVRDKLKYLFTSQKYGGRKVTKVEQLNTTDGDCYELFCLKWDDVLHICKGTWIVEKQKLTVIPFFDSFKEPFKQQLNRLIEISNTAIQAKRGDTSFGPHKESVNRPSLMLKPSEIPFKVSPSEANASVETLHNTAKNHSESKDLQRTFSSSSSMSSVSDFTTGEEDRKAVSRTGKKDDIKSAKPVLEHPYILTLLHLLKFENAVHKKYNMVKLTICESDWEVEITGPVASLKIIQKLLTEEDECDHPALTETFLGNEGALQDLKTFIDSAGLYVNIVDTQGKPFLQVRDGKERKETFHDFILTLVVSKQCSPLPSRECEKEAEWMKFVQSFEDTYTHQHIFVEDTSVTLVCLASRSQDMDFMVNIINNTICQLNRDLKSMPNSDHISQSSKRPDEGIQSLGNASSMGRKEMSEFSKTICIENSVLLWILNVLNLKDSLRQVTDDLDVDIDEMEEEIVISGSKELFQKLKSVIVKENKKFQFTENEQALLCDPIVRESLKSCLISQGCCILLDDSLEIFVASKDGHQAHFRDFLATFIRFKTISDLPKKYQRSKQWTTLLEHFKNNYPHRHILIADDQVYLLSIAADEKDTQTVSILKELEAAITALTSPEFSGKNLSLPGAISDKKYEGVKTDSTNISVADRRSVKKVTLCYKHPVLLRILKTLQLKEAADKFGVSMAMNSDDEIIIEGPKKTVKSLESVLMHEDIEMPFEDEETFLADVQILQKLDSCLKDSGACLVLDEKNLELFVITESGEKVTFRQFLTRLIRFKSDSRLLDKYQQTREWNSLIERCNSSYPHHHILTADDQVYVLFIAADEKNAEVDSLLKQLAADVTVLTSPVQPLNKEIVDQKREGMQIDGSSQLSATDKSSRKKVTLCYKHSVLLRILKNLQLKAAAQKFGVYVTMTADEIIMEGPRNMVRTLEGLLMQEDNEMPFEEEETFLAEEQIQQSLDSCLKNSGAHLVLDEKNLELFVITKSGPEAKFRDFLTSFIQFKTVTHLPEKYCRSQQWTSLLEHCKQNYPYHHILTADDQVYLLSIAANETDTQTVSLLKDLATTITALTSPVLSETDLFSAKEIQDQMVEEFKIDDSKMSAADLGSKKKVTLCYKHPVLFQILNNLHLKEAAHKSGVCVTMSAEDKVIIEGPKKAVKRLESVLIEEDNEWPFEDQEEFFINPGVCQRLDLCLKDSRVHLGLDDHLELFVVNKSGKKEHFRTFVTRFIRFQKCADIPDKYLNDAEWNTKLRQFEEYNPPHLILTNAEEVYLLTISFHDESAEADTIIEKINKAILDSSLSLDSDMDVEDECHKWSIDIPPEKVRYFELYLFKELQDMCDSHKSSRPKVAFKGGCLNIDSSSRDTNNKMASWLEESLSKLKCETKQYTFPGLSTYLHTEGLGLIQSLSEQYQCLIEVPDTVNSHPHLSLNQEQSSENSQGLEYKVIFIGTASCSGFNIHLVQGDLNDLNLKMKIQLQPSDEVKTCEIRVLKTSQNVIMQLPPWSAPNGDNYSSHLEKLRNSFNEAVSVALEQAKYLGQYDIAFSTANLTKSKHPFPASVIAKGVINTLVEKTGSNLASSQVQNKTIDIYICDPGNEAVFNAFVFFLKLRYTYFNSPSQDAWNKVCFPDSYSYPDFSHFKSRGFQIEVSSSIPASLGPSVSVFYPVHPSLEISTCPALREHSSAERSLKSSLIDLQHQNPDGLLAGDTAPLKGFYDGRKSFVYSSPDWGMDCGKEIENILKNCFRASGDCEVVYIIPPGMQLLSKYPVAYLVQILFRNLDNIIQDTRLLERKKRLVLLVQDPHYRKAFNDELEKRFPKKEKQGFLETFFSYFGYKEKENISHKPIPKTVTTESSVPCTVVTFVGASYFDIQKAAMQLENNLIGLMKEHSQIRHLNKQQTGSFKNFSEHINSDLLVKFSFKMCYEIENTNYNKKGDKNASSVKLSKSSLKINGLCEHYIDEFLINAGLIRDTEEDIKKTEKENPHGKMTAVLKNSGHNRDTEEMIIKTEKGSTRSKSTAPLAKTSKNGNSSKGSRPQKKDSKLSKGGGASNVVPEKGPGYWMWEVESDSNFQEIGKLSSEIEAAYSSRQTDFKPSSGKYTLFDFTSMAVHKNKNKTGIIRIEIFDEQPISFKKPKIDLLKEDSKEFMQIKSQLASLIEKYNLLLVEVHKVEANHLHDRFNRKFAQLKHKEHNWMWHRTLHKYRQSVCRFGFHPRFSGMPEAKHLGDGVLFYTTPDKFLNPEMEKGQEIHLVSAMVLSGRSGPGELGLRCPPVDETTGESFDSVSEDGACMIFSDAQAYPNHVITLKVKET